MWKRDRQIGESRKLEETKSEATLVVACDMPYLSAPFLDYPLASTRDADGQR
jgi:molybdopterin-guanine dinucleotide biosynthesis protein A